MCGGQKRGRDLCSACYHDKQREARRAIQRLWHEGRSLKEIASTLGRTVNSIGSSICDMRADGWDVPYRQNRRAEKTAA